MKSVHRNFCFCGALMLVACAEEPPPTSVSEFMENPRILEAIMVRCAQNRSESRYVADCINARDAVNRIEAAEERTRREGLERQSERKRQQLRRTQEAVAEARRRAIEDERRRKEEEYLGIFGQTPEQAQNQAEGSAQAQPSSNAPSAVVEPMPEAEEEIVVPEENAAPEPETDLGKIREELKRRQETEEVN